MEYRITDKRNKLDLIISVKKFWKYYWMKKMLQNDTQHDLHTLT